MSPVPESHPTPLDDAARRAGGAVAALATLVLEELKGFELGLGLLGRRLELLDRRLDLPRLEHVAQIEHDQALETELRGVIGRLEERIADLESSIEYVTERVSSIENKLDHEGSERYRKDEDLDSDIRRVDSRVDDLERKLDSVSRGY